MGSSREALRSFPEQVRRDIGQALYAAQQGETDPAAKPLKGFGGARVMEVVERHATNAYRAVYTTQFAGRIYVLHAFQKKSTKGIATPQKESSSSGNGWPPPRATTEKGRTDHEEREQESQGGRGQRQRVCRP